MAALEKQQAVMFANESAAAEENALADMQQACTHLATELYVVLLMQCSGHAVGDCGCVGAG